MDTSINLEKALVIDLKTSGCAEEMKLATKAEGLIWEITSRLKPILKYITAPQFIHVPVTQGNFLRVGVGSLDREYRVLYLCQTKKQTKFEKEPFSRSLFLDENGEFFTTDGNYSCSVGRCEVLEKVGSKESTWQYFPFGEVLESLRSALKAAEEKREKHLQSIRDAREMLDKAIAAISPTS